MLQAAEIQQFLEEYGAALSCGDGPTLARCWAVPALVLADEGAIAIAEVDEVVRFFAQAAAWYRAQGLRSIRPELARVEELSEQLAAVDGRWPACDAAGQEQTSEYSHYLLQRGTDGQLRMRVALSRTRRGHGPPRQAADLTATPGGSPQ